MRRPLSLRFVTGSGLPSHISLPFARSIQRSCPRRCSRTSSAPLNNVPGQIPANVDQASNYLDDALTYAGHWPQPTTKGGAAAKAAAMFRDYQESAEESIRVLRDELETTRRHASEDRESAEQARAALEVRVSAVEAAAVTAESRVTAEVTRLDTALTNNSRAFTDAQKTRSAEFLELFDKLSARYDEQAKPHISKLAEQEKKGNAQLAASTKLHADTEKMAGKAAGSILAKDYGSYAQREWWAAIVAYALGFAVVVTAGGLLVSTVEGIAKNDKLSWQFVALKLGLTLTGAGIAAMAL
jgi:hypothetical protein